MFEVTSFDAKSLSWWYYNRDKIDMEPIYQRKGNIWNDHSRAFLIDSILNSFDIPKLYIADFVLQNSSLNYRNNTMLLLMINKD